jgi:protein involved in polysaccharide export with SLBB domain
MTLMKIIVERVILSAFLVMMGMSFAVAQSVPPAPPVTESHGDPSGAGLSNSEQDGRHFITESTDPSYVLKANDYIQIVIFQEDDLNTITRISPEGEISFPLIGHVKLGGLTVQDASDKIRSMLMDGYIRDPKVSLTVTEFASRRFFVLGEVQRPGSFEMPQEESVSLLQAIAIAGGYTKIADPGRVTVKRLQDGKEMVYKLNAKAMARDSDAKQFYVQPDDTITVAESLF